MTKTLEKTKHPEKNLSQCHFVYHKFDMDWPGIETGSPR
jgi:hypothetical protein